eukprot:m.8936 g.8936  ORF g.8936 m.8936 type:complete len:212 (+) comp20990_c0_seq2:39-674(+)
MDSPWATVRAGWNIFDTLDVNDDLCRHMYQDELIERDEWDKMKLTNAQNSDKVRQLLFDILPSKDDSWRKFSNILIRTSQGHFLEKLKKQEKYLEESEKADNIVECQISKEHIRSLSPKISHKWRSVARSLGPGYILEDYEIEIIAAKPGTDEDRCSAMLSKWVDRAKDHATILELVRVLVHHEIGLSDAAKNVFGKDIVRQCRQLSEKRP